jgi:hypothetical protein
LLGWIHNILMYNVLSVEILGYFIWAHSRFQKFLEISKPMCVSPFGMQPKFFGCTKARGGS